MRTISTGFLACAVYVLAPALAFGQPQAPPRPEGESGPAPRGARARAALTTTRPAFSGG